MTVFLCGFMGCGKTTVGKKLAEISGRGYCDTDELIVKRAGMPIPDIFKKYGEPYFRKLETDIIKELCDFNGIAACGGGAMLSDINSGIARENGIVVFLDVPFKTSFYRISGDSNRPVAASRTPKQLEELFNERYPVYKKNSSMTIKCEGGPLSVAKEIMDNLSLFQK